MKDNHHSNTKRKPCVPVVEHGKTYLTIGQDLFSMNEYLQDIYNYSLHEYMKKKNKKSNSNTTNDQMIHPIGRPISDPFLSSSSLYQPAAFMVYTDIQQLEGLDRPIDYGSGVEYADALLVSSSSLLDNGGNDRTNALQIGLWLNGTNGCRDIVHGHLEPQIQSLIQYCSTTLAERIFLRIGYEFDNPDFGYMDDPTMFRTAFRIIVDRLQHISKMDFVWHSWGASLLDSEQLAQYYPGSDYVDWVGISLFTQFYDNSTTGTIETVQTVLDFAQQHHKPIMIAESTPYGGINTMKDPWERWFEPVLQLIEKYDIGMWSYIHCNWNTQPMWEHSGFGDTRLKTNLTVFDLWYQHVLQNPRFVFASDRTTASWQHTYKCQRLVSSPKQPILLRTSGWLINDPTKIDLKSGSSTSLVWMGLITVAAITLLLMQLFYKYPYHPKPWIPYDIVETKQMKEEEEEDQSNPYHDEIRMGTAYNNYGTLQQILVL